MAFTALAMPHRFTVDEYHRMAEVGLLGEDDRVELLEGEIIDMSPIGSRHAACVNRLTRLLATGLGDRAIVAVQNPVRVSDLSEPQPDLAVLRARDDFYAEQLPGPADVLLLIEVADTSLAFDRHVKVPLYARAGVPEVWVVDLDGEVVEVFRGPGPEGYADAARAGRHESLAAAGVSVTAAEILG